MPALLTSAPTGGRAPSTTASAASTEASSVTSQRDADGLHAVLLGDLVGDVLGPGLVEVEHGDVPARGGEGVGGGAADAALRARAGDDGGVGGGLHGCS